MSLLISVNLVPVKNQVAKEHCVKGYMAFLKFWLLVYSANMYEGKLEAFRKQSLYTKVQTIFIAFILQQVFCKGTWSTLSHI